MFVVMLFNIDITASSGLNVGIDIDFNQALMHAKKHFGHELSRQEIENIKTELERTGSYSDSICYKDEQGTLFNSFFKLNLKKDQNGRYEKFDDGQKNTINLDFKHKEQYQSDNTLFYASSAAIGAVLLCAMYFIINQCMKIDTTLENKIKAVMEDNRSLVEACMNDQDPQAFDSLLNACLAVPGLNAYRDKVVTILRKQLDQLQEMVPAQN